MAIFDPWKGREKREKGGRVREGGKKEEVCVCGGGGLLVLRADKEITGLVPRSQLILSIIRRPMFAFKW